MSIKTFFLSGALLVGVLSTAAPTFANTEHYIGEVILAGFNFCPRGTVAAEGQLLSIAQNMALFSLYGTIYGGDGRSTFAVPDLRGRTVVGAGTGPSLTPRDIGAKGGAERAVGYSSEVSKGTDAIAQRFKEGGEYNMQPFQVMKYCVVVDGVFPSRN